jgi:mono/diheme cytochrome c family protein
MLISKASTVRYLVTIAALLPVVAAGEPATRTPSSGRDIFLTECARCHGAEGRGDGPDAALFSSPPRDLTTGFIELYDTEDVVQRLGRGAPLSIAIDREAVRKRLANVEVIVAHLERLPKLDWKKIDAGAATFHARCEPCHGSFGNPRTLDVLPPGVQSRPRDLRDPAFQAAKSDADLERAFRQGAHHMPAMAPPLSDLDAANLVAFLRLLSPGFETYSHFCAICHGDDGRGQGVLAKESDRPSVVFDEQYLAKADSEELRVQVWHMLDRAGGTMPHFQESLDDAQLRAVVEYLRTRQAKEKPSPR